ncbi:hypothetical protein IJ182_05900 [bacterium]|nr:hypothetical protein [bacterium]
MINIINISRPTFCHNKDYKNPKYPLERNNKDTFVSEKDKNKMSSDKYQKVNENFDVQKNIDILSKRIKSLPIMMSRVIGSIQGYLSGNITRDFFVKVYQDETVPLYKRIEFGEQSDKYKETYKPEIDTIKEVSKLTSKYTNNEITSSEFDSEIETAAEEYTSKEIKRNIKFII